MKITTKHLSYEHGFVSIIDKDGDDIECGMISESGRDNCSWPDELGGTIDEPEWFGDEVSHLIDAVMDDSYHKSKEDRDYINQIEHDYLQAKGAK